MPPIRKVSLNQGVFCFHPLKFSEVHSACSIIKYLSFSRAREQQHVSNVVLLHFAFVCEAFRQREQREWRHHYFLPVLNVLWLVIYVVFSKGKCRSFVSMAIPYKLWRKYFYPNSVLVWGYFNSCHKKSKAHLEWDFINMCMIPCCVCVCMYTYINKILLKIK